LTEKNIFVQLVIQNLKKGKIPPQAVSNNLQIFSLPESISTLRRLEKVIIAKRILFKRVAIMPKGQCPKIKGSICNVPIKADEISNVLPDAFIFSLSKKFFFI